jgi:hypothetical protein
MLGEEFYARTAREREATVAGYCKTCGGTGFNMLKPVMCKNCKGTTVRGTGKCHKCEMSLAPDYKPVATGLTFNDCPDCHPSTYNPKVKLNPVKTGIDPNPSPVVTSNHEQHGGVRDVRCVWHPKTGHSIDPVQAQ